MRLLRISFLLVVLLSVLASGQNYPTKDGIDYDLLQKYHARQSLGTATYQSEFELPDSTERIVQENDPDDISVRTQEQVKLFGYNLFQRRGTTLEIPQNLAVPSNYKLGPADHLVLNLWGRVEQQYELTVDRQGAVFIPRVGEVPLWGLTLQQAEQRLKKKLETVYSDFKLAISLGKLKSIQVLVFGEVKYPGSYTLNSLSTLFSALYLAGGPTETGSLRKIKLIRAGNEIAIVDLYQFLLYGNDVAELALQSGDIVFVDIVGQRITITGEVKRPAIFETKGVETADDVIAMAGGPLPSAYLDKVRVHRITNGDGYRVIDLDINDNDGAESAFLMEDGDEVFVESIYDVTEDVVFLEGEFRHPGPYQYRDGMTLSQLLGDGCELADSAYQNRIDILRKTIDGNTSLIPVDPGRLAARQFDLTLKSGDRLIAYHRDAVIPEKKVSIYGLVQDPGEYRLYENMQVSDLIFKAGNLRVNAYPLRAEVARTAPDGSKEILYASLNDPGDDLILQTNDKVFVREIPGWAEQDLVTVSGEVRFPGKYVITSDMNGLANLIRRAGGLTDDAFVQGAVFTRATIIEDLKRRGIEELINRSAEKQYDSAGNIRVDSATILQDNAMSNRIVIDVTKALVDSGNGFNIELAPGDEIFIPRKPTGVQILGAVPSISTIAYQSGYKLKHYINSAGGYLRNADKNQIQLIRADGSIISGKKANSKEVLLGDAIFVPTRITKQRDWFKILTSSVSIVASIATTVFVIDRL